jgi:hypothetical protein
MIKNILLPLILILLTSAGTIYLWYEDSPLNFFGIIGFFTLGFGNMYISYYIFYAIFPDKRNKPLPAIQDLMYYKEKGKPQTFTIGSTLAPLFTIILTVVGIWAWTKLADKYLEYELTNHGQTTTAIIIDYGYSKGIGKYRKYEYKDNNGELRNDKFSNETLNIGDTITILFSVNRPILNKVISPSDEE